MRGGSLLRGPGRLCLATVGLVLSLGGCDKLQIPELGNQAATSGTTAAPTPAAVPAAVPGPASATPAPAVTDPAQAVAAFLEQSRKPEGLTDHDIVRVTDLTTGLDAVTELKLTGSAITDVGVARLHKFPALNTLDLSATKITEEGAKLLKDLPALRKLGLGHTLIGDGAMVYVGELPHLQELTLTRISVSDTGLAQLGRLSDLEVLDISDTIGVTGTFFQNLKGNKKLRVLRAHHTMMRPEALKFLVHCPLEELNLEATGLNDFGMLVIGKMTRLKRLNVGHNGITDDSIRKMGLMKDLEQASFRNNNGISNVLFAKLIRCKKLQTLDVAGTRINAADIAKLAKALPNCKIIN